MLCYLHGSRKSKQSSVWWYPGLSSTCIYWIKGAEKYFLLRCKEATQDLKLLCEGMSCARCKLFLVFSPGSWWLRDNCGSGCTSNTSSVSPFFLSCSTQSWFSFILIAKFILPVFSLTERLYARCRGFLYCWDWKMYHLLGTCNREAVS